jgi:hypothetical protein
MSYFSDIVALADVVRNQQGIKKKLTLEEIAMYADIDSYTIENDTAINSIVDGTISDLSTEDITPFSIPKDFFINNKNLTTVNCRGLKEVGVSSFGNCELTSFVAPDLEVVGESAFYSCDKLVEIECPNVTSLSTRSFASTGLTRIFLPKVNTVPPYCFYGSFSLAEADIENLEEVELYGFCDTALTKLPSNKIRKIALNGLAGTHITEVSSEILREIGQGAFRYCENLQRIDLPNLTTLPDNGAFDHCTALTEVNLPNYEIIPQETFSYTGLTSYPFDRVKFLRVSSFAGTPLTEVSSSSIETIEAYTFRECTSLTKVNLPNCKNGSMSLDYTFSKCTSLAEVNLPEITSFGNFMFESCTSLSSIDLKNVTTYGASVFANCTGLTSFTNFREDSVLNGDKLFSGLNIIPQLSSWENVTIGTGGIFKNMTAEELNFYGIDLNKKANHFSFCSNLKKLRLIESKGLNRLFQTNATPLDEVVLHVTDSPILNYTIFGPSTTSTINILILDIKGFSSIANLGRTVKSLNTLIIRDNSLISLSSSSAFNSSDLGTENGRIYVPSALVSSYKTATNWTQYADKIFAIEEMGE